MRNAVPSFVGVELRSAGKRRHWSPSSQTYAPVDVLLEYLVADWNLNPVVGLEKFWYGGGRHVAVYYVELTKGNQTVVMPVHANPVVRRLIVERQLRVMPLPCDEVRLFEDEVPTLEFVQTTGC